MTGGVPAVKAYVPKSRYAGGANVRVPAEESYIRNASELPPLLPAMIMSADTTILEIITEWAVRAGVTGVPTRTPLRAVLAARPSGTVTITPLELLSHRRLSGAEKFVVIICFPYLTGKPFAIACAFAKP